MNFISKNLLQDLLSQAEQSPRLRKNHNFHTHHEATCHRLLNALAVGTYIQPHRHLDQNKDETLIVVQGKLGVLWFDDDGQVIQTQILSPQPNDETTHIGVHIPSGQFHSMVALEPSIFFEAKAGPYVPIADNEKANFAPSEGQAACASYLQFMQNYFI